MLKLTMVKSGKLYKAQEPPQRNIVAIYVMKKISFKLGLQWMQGVEKQTQNSKTQKAKTKLLQLCSLSPEDNFKKKVLSRTESYSPCRAFVEEKLGSKYVIGRTLDFAVCFEESGPATPMFFILSPGVDPLKDVEKHGNILHLFFISTQPFN